MSLPVPNLDDRNYQDLVDEAKRLIPTYCPEWTNHNLSDPGVALIELFAWMSEMTMFRLNQVPDAFYTRMLNLVGVESFSATAATADLTFWVVPGETDNVVLPLGTEVATNTDDDPVIFTTIEPLTVVSPETTSAMVSDGKESFTDVWAELGYDRESVVCFPTLTPGEAFYLGFDRSLSGMAIRLDIRASIEGIGVDPNNAPLMWQVWNGEAWAPVKVYRDTTGGLNRDGSVTMLVPRQHKPLTLNDTQAHWIRAVLLPTSPGQSGYRASPQIRTLDATAVGGTVTAEHSRAIEAEFLGISDGQADQRFVVGSVPVLPRRRGEGIVVRTDTGVEEWKEVDDFTGSNPQDKHYVWQNTTGEVVFGPLIRNPDGTSKQHGAIPAGGADISVAKYRHGGGARGNVGSRTLTALRTTVPYVSRVENIEPAIGGVDAESVENVKLRGPATLRTGERAVTVSDYERVALGADHAIARARCLAPVEPGKPIRLLIVPAVEGVEEQADLDAYALPQPMIQKVSDRLDGRRILGTEVEIGTPYYQGVSITALMKSLPGRPAGVVRSRALEVLYAYLNPITGGSEGKGWPFDTDLNAATVNQVLEAVDGVERVDEVLFFEYDLRNGVRHGAGKELIRLAPDSLFVSKKHRIVMR